MIVGEHMDIPQIVLEEILAIAKRYPQIYKIILYGSRARGDNQPTSDIDLAIYTADHQEVPQFSFDIDEQTSTMLKFDVALITPKTDKNFVRNINKDGVILMSTFAEKIKVFQKAVANLIEATEKYNSTHDDLMRDGVIQRFEYTAELAWKTTRAYLLEQNVRNIDFPRSVMKEAYATGLIENETDWDDLLKSRNLTSHLYDENLAEEIYHKIEHTFLPLFIQLADKLEQTN